MMELVTDIKMNVTVQLFDPERPVIMMFDASPWAISCVIGQLAIQEIHGQVITPLDQYRRILPTTYLSNILNKMQERWTQTEKEAYAVYYFTSKNRHLLYGVRLFFYTDCQCLTYIYNLRSTNNNINRWVLALQEFGFTIHHVPGRTLIVPDALSRVPWELLEEVERVETELVSKKHEID